MTFRDRAGVLVYSGRRENPAMSSPASTRYDQVAYPTLPMPQSHPDRLATIALLFGMTPQPIDRCRVLELGCGDGMNIIPMAHGLAGSEFVGIDLAATPIAMGHATIAALGLRNVALRQLDIMDLGEELGTFDYIIAHGVYSWVPEATRDRLLAICRAHLAPQGVAYVSYNVYPGGHLRQAVRHVLQFHIGGIEDPRETIAQARALARFIAESPGRGERDDPDLRLEMRAMLDRNPDALFHDDLAPVNEPVYFHEFVAHSARHRLQFLAEANFSDSQARSYPPETVEKLEQLTGGRPLLIEQYLDFLKNRRFRRSLLCRQEIALDRGLRRDVVRGLVVGSQATPEAGRPDLASPGVVEAFRGPRGSGLSTNVPLAKAAIFHLGKIWPYAVSFDALVSATGDYLDERTRSTVDATTLADILLAAYAAGVIELSTSPPRFVVEPGPRPTANPVARVQLARGSSMVTNLRHASIEIGDELTRHLVGLMDGTRTSEALRAEMNARVEPPLEITRAAIDTKVAEAASFALLVA